MERLSSEQIRRRDFDAERRGYDRHQVHAFLATIADEVEYREQNPSEALKRRFEEAGSQAASVLAAAEQQAERTREESDEYAGRVRSEADEYTQQVRGEADEVRQKVIDEAREAAQRIMAEAERNRSHVEQAILALAERRDLVYEEIAALNGELGAVLSRRPVPGAELTEPAVGDRPAKAGDQSDPAEQATGTADTIASVDDQADEPDETPARVTPFEGPAPEMRVWSRRDETAETEPEEDEYVSEDAGQETVGYGPDTMEQFGLDTDEMPPAAVDTSEIARGDDDTDDDTTGSRDYERWGEGRR
ncbi:MAG: DivIVA domain-containing protein [Solirubrobacterales bacterium]